VTLADRAAFRVVLLLREACRQQAVTLGLLRKAQGCLVRLEENPPRRFEPQGPRVPLPAAPASRSGGLAADRRYRRIPSDAYRGPLPAGGDEPPPAWSRRGKSRPAPPDPAPPSRRLPQAGGPRARPETRSARPAGALPSHRDRPCGKYNDFPRHGKEKAQDVLGKRAAGATRRVGSYP
jgi:hypothetical protein